MVDHYSQDCKDNELDTFAPMASLVNPHNASLRVLYPGSGGDILTPVLVTNTDRSVHIDEVPLSDSYGNFWPLGRTVDRMMEEILLLEVSNLQIIDEGDSGNVSFDFCHPHDTKARRRKIQFYARDYFAFWPKEFEGDYDVLITRGEAPQFNTHDIQIQQLGEKMSVGGFFISDREIARFIRPNWLGFESIENTTIFPCGPAFLYRKVSAIDPTLLSNLLRFVDLVDYLDDYAFNEPHDTVIKKVEDLLILIAKLPGLMSEEALRLASRNMRWLRSTSFETDFPFSGELNRTFRHAFSTNLQ